MTTLYLIRHGRTDWNKQEVFRGRADRLLDQVGEQQALAISEALAREQIQGVFTSPLVRARDTAAPLAKRLGLEVSPHQGLNDMDFGQWQGLSLPQVKERFPEMFQKWAQDPFSAKIPDGETLAQVWERASAALNQICAMNGIRQAAVITHRAVLKVLLCGFIEAGSKAFWAFKIDPGSISEIQYHPPRASFVRLNHTVHLEGVGESGPPPDF